MAQTVREKYEDSDDWRERAHVINFYHKLKKVGDKKHKLADTAKYFGVSVALICEDIQLAENMEKLVDAPSRKQALVTLRNWVEPIVPTNG